MSKRTFIIKVKINSQSKNLPDWGLGPGIIVTQEIVMPARYKNVDLSEDASFQAQMYNLYSDLVKENLEPIFEEVIKTKSTPPKKPI